MEDYSYEKPYYMNKKEDISNGKSSHQLVQEYAYVS